MLPPRVQDVLDAARAVTHARMGWTLSETLRQLRAALYALDNPDDVPDPAPVVALHRLCVQRQGRQHSRSRRRTHA